MRGKKKDGGGVKVEDKAPSVSYTNANPVETEAKKKAKGGAVCKPDGDMKAKRGDRPGRKLGGRVGADKAPLSSAANASAPPGRSIS